MLRRLIQLGVCIFGWAMIAHAPVELQASLIVCDDVEVDALDASMIPQERQADEGPLDPTSHQLDQMPNVPGTGGPGTSITTTFAGHAAIVIPTCVLPPPLVVRVLGDASLIFPEPHPTGILRPPRAS
jgi:hypothetical protein